MKYAACARLCFTSFSIAMLIGAAMSVDAFSQANPAERTVAITFDDLPLTGPTREREPLAVAVESNRRIIEALRRYRAPATGFVNEAHISSIGTGADRMLSAWNRGRYELANHGFSHADANALDLPSIEREIIQGERTIGPLVRKAGRKLRFFRFPYNHLGDTAEKQAGAVAFLRSRGYQLAASTIDTSDYVFDKAFTRALGNRDSAMQARIKQAFLDYTAKQIAYYAELNRKVLGYEPPAIMLLHINRINAATLEAQLGLFRKAGYRFVSLSQAQSDPVYAETPRVPTRFGPMWGYRWARDRGIKVDGRLEEEPPAWVSDYGEAKSAS
jgi:peptidoglycan/xylan/chitin deacetylase (PgdA/CDA1 family)